MPLRITVAVNRMKDKQYCKLVPSVLFQIFVIYKHQQERDNCHSVWQVIYKAKMEF